MKKLNLLCFSLLVLLAASCTEDYVSTTNDTFDEVVNVTAELSNTDAVQISLLKNIGIGADISEAELSNAEITFTSIEEPESPMSMLYNVDRKRYVLQDPEYRVREGSWYDLNIVTDPNSLEEDEISATTYIPKAVAAAGWEVINKEEEVLDTKGNKMYRMELFIKMNPPEELPAYYHIVPFRRHTELRRNNDGTSSVVDFGIRYEMSVEEVLESQNGIVTLAQKSGVYVDQSRIQDNRVRMIVETNKPLSSKEVLSILEVEIYTLSADLYQYNMSLDREIRDSRNNSLNVKFSNVRNAAGIFGGSSRSLLPILLPK